MAPLSLRGKKCYLAVAAFLLLFGALLTVATFCDLEVSRILTKFSLKKGDYYTADVFANFFEAAGMLPSSLMAAFAAICLGWYVWKSFLHKTIRVVLFLVAAGVAAHLLSGGFRDPIFYPMRHVIAEDITAAENAIRALSPTVYLLSYVLSASTIGVALFCTRNVSYKVWSRLAYFALAYFLMSLLADALVSFLKS